MTMLLLEGFEGYADVDDSQSGGLCRGDTWNGNSGALASSRYVDHGERGLAKRFGDEYYDGAKHIETFYLNQTVATVGVAIASNDERSVVGAPALLVDLEDYDGDVVNLFCRVIVDADNNWAVRCDATGEEFATDLELSLDLWTYIEMSLELTGPTTANIKMRINGVLKVDVSVAAGGLQITRALIVLGRNYSAASLFADDFYLSDDLVWHGPLAIVRQPMTQATLDDWDPVGAATPLLCVDEEACDLDATYMRAAGDGLKQSFTAQFDLRPDFIQVSTTIRTEALSPFQFKLIDGVPGTYRETPLTQLTEEYIREWTILDTLYDGSPITAAGASAQEYGIELVEI